MSRPVTSLRKGDRNYPKSGSVMGFDYGNKRIGVAIGDLELKMAQPISPLSNVGIDGLFDEIGKLVREWGPKIFVVGYPGENGSRTHPMRGKIERFAIKLEKIFFKPVYFVNENYSSTYANELLSEAVVDWRTRKSILDSFSAKVILDGFFEECGSI